MKKNNIIYGASLVYLWLPFILFSVGFLRLYIGIPIVCLLFYCLKKVYEQRSNIDVSGISLKQHTLLFFVSLFVCFHSGIGSFWSQTYDFVVKNPLLLDLTTREWPLFYDLSDQIPEVQDHIGSDTVAFVYYLFYYLVPAFVGKLFGSELVSRFAILLYSTIGLYFVLVSIVKFVLNGKHPCLRNIFIFMFLYFMFGGLDIIGDLFLKTINGDVEFSVKYIKDNVIFCSSELWCLPWFFQYDSHLGHMSWGFNQCVPVWLITSLVLQRRNSNSIFFLYCPVLLYSPWATIGLFFIVAYIWFVNVHKDKMFFFKSFSIYNVLFPLLLLLVVGSYYLSNSGSTGENSWWWQEITPLYFVTHYPVYLLVEVGVYFFVLRKHIVSTPILLGSFVVLAILPIYKLSPVNDLLIRGSIPSLFIISCFWIKWVFGNYAKCFKNKMLVLITLFFTSIVSVQFYVIKDTAIFFHNSFYINNQIPSFNSLTEDVFFIDLCERQFFLHNSSSCFFYKYLGVNNEKQK